MGTIAGLKELSLKLNQLEKKMAAKTLRKAARDALKPTQAKVKAAAPVGSHKDKRTYKGNVKFAGYLKRSIRMRTKMENGRAKVMLGVLKEAFYGVSFMDKGVTVRKRRKSGRGGSAGGGKPVKAYRISGKHWFEQNFINDRQNIEKRFRANLKKEIDKVTR